jgi:chromosome partitioning protein
VIELWRYIADRLEKNFRRTVFAVPGAQPVPLQNRAAGGGFGRRGVGQ